MSATIGFMPSYKRQSSGRERKILKKSKNTVKRTLELCTTLCVCRFYLHIIVCSRHNKKIETIHSHTYPSKQCNCRDKETCPRLGNCLQKNVVYRVTVKTKNSVKQYIGATERTIKQRIYNHKLSFTNRNYLCLHEKLAIITHPSQNTMLNKKPEILSKCRHENKHLSNFDLYT